MGRGQGREFLGKARLLQRQVAQDIDKECFLVGIVAVEGLLRGNARLRQDGTNACRQVPLLEKEPVGSGTKPLAGLLGACVLSVFHFHPSHNRNVKYVTIMGQRAVIVKGQSDAYSTRTLKSNPYNAA